MFGVSFYESLRLMKQANKINVVDNKITKKLLLYIILLNCHQPTLVVST